MILPTVFFRVVLVAALVLAACDAKQQEAEQDAARAAAERTGSELSVRSLDDRVEIRRGDQVILAYHFKDVSRPFFHPVLAPGGYELTRRWPILPAAAGEEKDHPHQRSLWFAHGDVNGHDFWTEGKEAGRIVQTSIDAKRTTRDTALIRSSDDWIAASGDRVLRDERVLRFVERDGRRTMDFVVRMIASDGDLVFGDTKEGTMAIRLTPSMRVEGEVAKGHLLMSTGLRDTKAWGTRAAWLHAQGPPLGASDETLIGVVMFDHPQNLRHPSWWHARTYGLLAANPFGIHAFTKQSKAPRPKDAGRFALAADKTLTLRYRFLLHQGALEAKDIEHEWAAYESAPPLDGVPLDGVPLDGVPLDSEEKKR